MKKILFILLILLSFFETFSQNYDLIVTTSEDPIVCSMDSITDTKIHFEREANNNRIHTKTKLSGIEEYEIKAINDKQVVFKNGKSYIDYVKKDSSYSSLKNSKKNLIFFEQVFFIFSLNYERMIVLSDHIGFTVKGGLGYSIDEIFFIGETTLLLGGSKHSFETGVTVTSTETEKRKYELFYRVGYRYQNSKGLVIRGAVVIYPAYTTNELIPLPGFSIGYSF